MFLEHLIFPVRCPCCEATARSFCGECRSELETWQARSCLRCAAEGPDSCLCALIPAVVRRVDSVWCFDGPVADVIEAAKYQGETWRLKRLRREVAGSLAALAGSLPRPFWVVPVPPSPRRLRRRGYDLATMLARWTARACSARLAAGGLRRTRRRPAQATLNRVKRLAQLHGSVESRLRGGSVLLIDDVITTGATIAECTRALASAGVTQVSVASMARTPKWSDRLAAPS